MLSFAASAPGAPHGLEEQYRQNFEIVSRLVTPGDPASSRLLLHRSSPKGGWATLFTAEAGQFASQMIRWQVLADWVRQTQK